MGRADMGALGDHGYPSSATMLIGAIDQGTSADPHRSDGCHYGREAGANDSRGQRARRAGLAVAVYPQSPWVASAAAHGGGRRPEHRASGQSSLKSDR
jgi:hypothetical protein